MKSDDVDDQVLFTHEKSDDLLQIVLNLETLNWSLFFGDGRTLDALTVGRRRVRLDPDGTFRILEEGVRLRKAPRQRHPITCEENAD